jgi:type IV pilus assembly protein PilW
MSMVELMVAMAIALIGVIIIFQVFEVSEGIRRTTTSGGDAQQNGAIGLYVIENDLRNAGMGFNDTPYAGCDAAAVDTGRAPNAFNLLMAPVQITAGAGNTLPDTLSIFYGSQGVVANSTTITAPMATPTSNVKIVPSGRYGFREGDLLLLFQPGTAFCELMEVTALPGSDDITHDNAPYNLTWVTSGPVGVTARFNPGAGSHQFTGVGAAATRVYNLGNFTTLRRASTTTARRRRSSAHHTVAGNNLTVTSRFAGAPSRSPTTSSTCALYGLDDGVSNNTKR